MIAVGVDVGKSFLDVAVHGEPTVQRFKNSTVGIAKLVLQLKKRAEVRIVVEATGGYEEAVLEACAAAGLWIARVNPRQARDFAKATGQLAKTDALDARILAEMVSVLLPPKKPCTAPAATPSTTPTTVRAIPNSTLTRKP